MTWTREVAFPIKLNCATGVGTNLVKGHKIALVIAGNYNLVSINITSVILQSIILC